jgi:acyl-CoA thioesterase
VNPELRTLVTSDPWARSLGIEFLEVTPGACRLALELKPHMLNFDGRPHGGVIFSLADVAFGAACNAHGVPNVAISVTIDYLSAPAPGSRLLAEAREVQREPSGFYEIRVMQADGTIVAAAHCVSQPVGPRGQGRRA